MTTSPGGYPVAFHILMENRSQDVLDTVFKSGLRGRGGAGYPTGLKWSTVAKAPEKLNTWYAMQMKEIREHSWTAAC